MGKRVIGIIVGALLVVGLMVLAWLWYLGRQEAASPTASSTASTRVPTNGRVGASNSSSVLVGPGGSGSTISRQRVMGGSYNASIGAYTVSGGSYYPATGTYTISNTLSGGTYNPATGTYTLSNGVLVTGGVYNPSTGTYTIGSGNMLSGGIYNPGTGTYTLNNGGQAGGGTYNPGTGTYTLNGGGSNPNPVVLAGGTFAPATGTYTIVGGTYDSSTGGYTVAVSLATNTGSVGVVAPNTCANGATDYPTCTPSTSVTHTCNNGAADYPTCTPPAVNQTCANGATDYPTCTPSTSITHTCNNGATDYPTCTPPVVNPNTCANGATDYPTCTSPACANGGTDYPTCTPPTVNQTCANGATDYPTCTPPACANGGTDYPTCTPHDVTPDPVVDSNATWIPDTGNPFSPTAINQISDTNPSGPGTIFNPVINTSNIANGSGPDALATTIAGLGISALACSGFLGMRTPAVPAGVAATAAVNTASGAAIPLSVPDNSVAGNLGLSLIAGGTAANLALKTADTNTDFWSCLTRAIAKQVLAQMTQSIVNWINSGFNGKPAFLQNSQAFFANVADQTAGQFIAGSGLAFLCSPFSLKIKIAIATAYANRNAAPSCTLTQVISNVTGFMNGNFSAGGWNGIVSFVTVPSNNPFGGFATAQVRLGNAILSSQQQNGSLISQTGYVASVNLTAQSCNNASNTYGVAASTNGKVPCPLGCECKVTTPGQAISDSLDSANKATFDSLNMAKNFDEIIGALITQLVTKMLQGGLSHLSDNGGYGGDTLNPAQSQAAALGTTLLSQLQQSAFVAQQFGGIHQDMITDIQSSQSQLTSLKNCWSSASSSSAFSAAKQAIAKNNADAAQAQITALEGQVSANNNAITQGNDVVTQIEQLQTQLLNASTLADVQAVQTAYTAANLLTQADITSAQQDRTTLQSSLDALNGNTSNGLQQCYAYAQTP